MNHSNYAEKDEKHRLYHRGKTLLLVIMAVRVTENILFDILYVNAMALGTGPFFGAVAGILVGGAMHMFLFYYLYKGARWSLICIILFGLLSLLFSFVNFSTFHLIDIMLIVICMATLLFNKSVNVFLAEQKRIKEST